MMQSSNHLELLTGLDPNASVPAGQINYKLKFLEESLRQNVIVALDSGFLKTHIVALVYHD
jgi:hypothetical protein